MPRAMSRAIPHLCDTDYKQLAREEYLDSEKYQLKGRDWNAPGNIKEIITRLNRIRRENRAFQQLRNLRLSTRRIMISCSATRRSTAGSGQYRARGGEARRLAHPGRFYRCRSPSLAWREGETYQVHDLLTDERYSGPAAAISCGSTAASRARLSRPPQGRQ